VGLVTTILLGLSAGAMIAEGAVLVPWWRSLTPQSFLSWYAANAARLFDFFAPLETGGAGLAVVAGALHQRGASRGPFVVAAVLALTVLAAFPVYFQDVNGRFEAGTIPLDEVGGELARWAMWHWGRTVIEVAAFAAALLGVRASGAAS
jgi:hypothetical protein